MPSLSERAAALWNPRDPHAYLLALPDPQRTRHTRVAVVQGHDRQIVGWTLRYEIPSGVDARFTPEGVLAGLSKLMRRELQTGDPAFDPVVYIETRTPERTAELLADEAIRKVIVGLVGGQGQVEIRPTYTALMGWVEDADLLPDPVMARFLAHVQATAG